MTYDFLRRLVGRLRADGTPPSRSAQAVQAAAADAIRSDRGQQSDDRRTTESGGVESLIRSADDVARQDPVRAVALYADAIALHGDQPVLYYKRGNLRRAARALEAALDDYDRAISLNPGFANAHCNRGVVLEQLGRADEARASYDRAIALNPLDPFAYHNRAGILRDLSLTDAALADYQRALELNPHYVQADCNRGLLLSRLSRWDEALAAYDRCIAADPGFFQAYFNRAVLHKECGRLQASLASYDSAIGLRPADADALNNRGVVLTELGRWEEGIESFHQAVRAREDFAEAFANRAGAYVHLGRHAQAVADYDRALALDPQSRFAVGARLHSKMQLCDWSDLESDLKRVETLLEAGAHASHPFHVLGLFDSPRLHEQAAAIWIREMFPRNDALGPVAAPRRRDRLRIGYFSPDFRDHPVAHLIADLFSHHDRSRFEIVGISLGPTTQDAYRKRIEQSFDRFFDMRLESDRAIASRARELQIDIAIDLGGHTALSRTGIFAMRAAPLQVNFLGYPGTMAADFYEYVLADRVLIPPQAERHFSERIIYLPNSYQPNSARSIAASLPTRAELGLPPRSFVFCCFNNNFKIAPPTFERWMRILDKVQDSVLWLLQSNDAVVSHLRREASVRGIDPDRLVFAPRMPTPEHLARHQAADLFLDTLPYNAHTTAADALVAGLPLITCSGESFASRVAASLLQAAGLPELIAGDPADYERLAVGLATDPVRLGRIRTQLAANRATQPLFDIQLFARQVEAAYTAIHERHLAGLPPAALHLP